MTLVKAFAIVMGLARNSDSAHKHASSSLEEYRAARLGPRDSLHRAER